MAKYQSTHTGAEIDAGIDLLNSNSATSGQVLTANGTGGASWKDVDEGFVAKVTNPGVVYCTDGNGNQSKINYANVVSNYTVVTRDASGHVRTADPEGQNDATNKKYVDDGFVAKRTTTDGIRLYAYDSNGDTSEMASATATPYTIARRDVSGHVRTADPEGQNDAVNKAYVDNRFRYTHFIEVEFNPAPEPYVSYVLIGTITYVSEVSTPLTSIDDLPLDVALPIHGMFAPDSTENHETYTATRKTRSNGTSCLDITYLYYNNNNGVTKEIQGDIVPTKFTDTVL